MKKLFLSIVAVGMAMTAGAQQTDKQMATLQHGDKTTVYYGIDALKQAYNDAADTLDVITLSSGEFNVPDPITKSISIYGAGFERDTITGTDATHLNGNINLRPADIVDGDGQTIVAARRVNGVHIEGLAFNNFYASDNSQTPIHNVTIAKCSFGHSRFAVTSYDCTIRQCRLSDYVGTNGSYASNIVANNLLVCNSYIEKGIFGFTPNSTVFIDHCILYHANYVTDYYKRFQPYTYVNNVLYVSPLAGSTLSNNILVSNGTPILDDNGNWRTVPNAALWAAEGEDGSYSEKKDFALKYPERYVGNDGTEIGLHGGVYAWNKIPCIPRITECTIDTENASNGTIKVNIKAEAQTKG